MLLYLFIKSFTSLLFVVISAIPVFETPAWAITQMPDILFRIASFNWYLPVYETIGVVIFLIWFTLNWKMVKVILSFFNVNLNA